MREPNEYAVDIVLCIDVTGSMYPIVDRLKGAAVTFPKRLEESTAARNKAIGGLRLRVVAYRDFRDNPVDALLESRFLSMPEQAAEFETVLRELEADGGGDEPESGLEALSVALNSDWERGPERRRHIVVLLTDASAHPLGVGRSAATYPPAVPATVAGIERGRADSGAERLLLFAPDTTPWNDIAAGWHHTVHVPSRPGGGLHEYDFAQIVEAIAASV